MKPHLTAQQYEAYRLASELPYGQKVTLGGVKAIAAGQLNGRLVFRIKGRNRDVLPGDPRLLEMVVEPKQEF